MSALEYLLRFVRLFYGKRLRNASNILLQDEMCVFAKRIKHESRTVTQAVVDAKSLQHLQVKEGRLCLHCKRIEAW